MKVLKVILFLFVTNLYAQDILSLKDRSKIIDKIIKERIGNVSKGYFVRQIGVFLFVKNATNINM